MLNAIGEGEEAGALAVSSDISRLEEINAEEETEKDHGYFTGRQLSEEDRILNKVEHNGLSLCCIKIFIINHL